MTEYVLWLMAFYIKPAGSKFKMLFQFKVKLSLNEKKDLFIKSTAKYGYCTVWIVLGCQKIYFLLYHGLASTVYNSCNAAASNTFYTISTGCLLEKILYALTPLLKKQCHARF